MNNIFISLSNAKGAFADYVSDLEIRHERVKFECIRGIPGTMESLRMLRTQQTNPPKVFMRSAMVYVNGKLICLHGDSNHEITSPSRFVSILIRSDIE